MLTQAARHAREAGNQKLAFDLAGQCLYEAVIQGHMGTVRDWLDVLPEAELEAHPQLRLAAAWALAVSERHEEAERLVARILEHSDVREVLRFECALISIGAAYYADEPDRCIALFAPWAETPPSREPKLLRMHANRLAMLAILQGDPAEARRHLQSAPRREAGRPLDYSMRWSEFVNGLSYLWEGQVLLGEDVLRPALLSTEATLGRRHPLACMFAALLAAIAYERDRLDEAAALLANRLDVIERVGAPEAVLVGYRTAARVAAAQGAEHRALDTLEALFAVGVARRLPRLCIAGLADQTRMHAGRFRSETCRVLAKRIDDIIAAEAPRHGALWLRGANLMQATAHANAAMASQDWPGVLKALTEAAPQADLMKLGRARIEIMALRAYALDRNGENGRSLMLEATSLAQTFGLMRIFVDTHPALADWALRVTGDTGENASKPVPLVRAVNPQPVPKQGGGPRVLPSMVLTPKEREVLEFLARNLSNKEIAQAMAVGEATVKWHLKNLFGKLGVGTRRHVVQRAQLLGFIEGME